MKTCITLFSKAYTCTRFGVGGCVFSLFHTFSKVQFNAIMTIDNKITMKTEKRLELLHLGSTLSDLLYVNTVSEDLMRDNEVLQLFFGILTEPLYVLPF